MHAKPRINVVGAVIMSNGRILCTQRGKGALKGLWEFPGGKLEVGESAKAALVREIDEELGCHIEVGDYLTTTVHEYPFAVVSLSTFYCRLTAGAPELTEHLAARWLSPGELSTLEWALADTPAVRLVEQDHAR